MSRRVEYDEDRVTTYRDRSINMQTYADVRMVADIADHLIKNGADRLSGSEIMRACLQAVHYTVEKKYETVEEARRFLEAIGVSTRQLSRPGYAQREYMKSLIVQDRVLEKRSDQEKERESLEEAMNRIADEMEKDPAFLTLSPSERWKKVSAALVKEGYTLE